jgi:uncharacterized protein (DUF362 family)
MNNNIDRREFIKKSIAAGIAAAAGSASFPQSLFGNPAGSKIDISVVNGTNYFDNTIKAVELLGGMNKFVSKGNKVGLLINSPWNKPGTYTNPDVAIAVLKMCLDAGAKEIYSIENASTSYWKRSKLFGQFEKEIDKIEAGNSKKNVGILKGKILKDADISEALLDVDVFINIPIVKNHQGTNFTANLKNMMGACSSSTNRYFHKGSKKSSAFGYYDDNEFLSQCIADVNLIRQPNLCVVDASEFVTSNGPAGPGELKKANKIAAGINCVAVDAYCATLLDLTPKEVLMIQYAHELGLGEIDINKLSIKEI